MLDKLGRKRPVKVKKVTRNEITDEESYVVILIINKLYEMVAKEKEK